MKRHPMHLTVSESERAVQFKNGRIRAILPPGRYSTLGGKNYALYPLGGHICDIPQNMLLQARGADSLVFLNVADATLSMHFVNGNFTELLGAGEYAFFADAGKHEFKSIDISDPAVSDDIPAHILDAVPAEFFCCEVNVADHEAARLYYNNKLQKLLSPGRYRFWRASGIAVSCDTVDMRLQQVDLPSQEMLTRDKVTVRFNFVCSYRIADPVKIESEIGSYQVQLYTAAQLALREYVGEHTLDEILENKKSMSAHLSEQLKKAGEGLYLDVSEASVKDIILPGEIRDIMNSVLAAEKQAQASVITRREEVASTRSLLNTAKLMEENRTLYRLKELEYIERISNNVGNINLNGGSDILEELCRVLRGKKED